MGLFGKHEYLDEPEVGEVDGNNVTLTHQAKMRNELWKCTPK
jgi:hypothetical protein